MKTYKSLLAACAIVLGTSFLTGTAQAYDGSLEDISLSGTAQKAYAPDMAYVFFTIIGSGQTSEEATAMAANKAAAAKRALLGNGITSDALETSNYNLPPFTTINKKSPATVLTTP